MKKTITFQKTYDHAVSRVWKALVSKEALNTWLMPTDDFKPEVDHNFHFRTTPRGSFDGIIRCQIKEVIPNQKLSYSWVNGQLDTMVTFNLREENGKTILDFEHSGFERLMDRLLIRNFLARGWKKTILSKLLPQYLSK